MAGQTLQFTAASGSNSLASLVWMVNGTPGGSPGVGTISTTGEYTAPSSNLPSSVSISAAGSSRSPAAPSVSVSFFSPDNFTPGTVSGTGNPLVASYSIPAPDGASVEVQFGTTKSYGLNTWAQPSLPGGGPVTLQVAGMRANTTYHMRATMNLPNGKTVTDSDQVFTTGSIPGNLPNITVQQTPAANLADGVELLCLFPLTSTSNPLTFVVTDLGGNIIWYNDIRPNPPYPAKLLPNGHFLLVVESTNVVRELDLAGNNYFFLPLSDVQAQLAAAGYNFPELSQLHHEIVQLPNGHLILLMNYGQDVNDALGARTVIGDLLVDWDRQQGPVWSWSTFDHIPTTHAPESTTDWTHSNAVVYTPDDGNLILSMRNQDWVIKINYKDGVGDGSILWRLGPGGDFTLPGGQAPIEWNYGQHYPTLTGPASAGVFPLMLFNNGNDRLVDPDDAVCGTAGQIACYSSVPVFQLDENAKTARVLSERVLAPTFSVCCGNASILTNGDLEYDVALNVYTPGQSYIQEVTSGANSQLVWQMNITGQLAYRGFRIPSLYPGVSWSQAAITAANAAAQPALKVASSR